ncbi:hypothetical protein JXA63_05085 [Candidatus Woesebacteria bacterium]|nr:hypothetical protein [Candidatus Woesebacteria bacterium]
MITKKEKIKNYYQQSIKLNLGDIDKILHAAGVEQNKYLDEFKKLFIKSSSNIVGKWDDGKKYIRTEYVMEMFGKSYPGRFLMSSVMMDSMINILDDLYDENLTRDERKMYLIEYLRVVAIFNMLGHSERLQKSIGNYFDKLITLAVAEQAILKEIEKAKSMKKIVKLSNKLLLMRSHDIDIFVQMVLEDKSVNYLSLLDCARCFRSINLLKKDILDLQHDIDNDQPTLVTNLRSRADFNFKVYVGELTDYFKKMLIKKKKYIKNDYKLIYNNLMKMFDNESNVLFEILKTN